MLRTIIKLVYEVDPLKCSKCGGEMKIIEFIEEAAIIEKILRHSDLWMVAEKSKQRAACENKSAAN